MYSFNSTKYCKKIKYYIFLNYNKLEKKTPTHEKSIRCNHTISFLSVKKLVSATRHSVFLSSGGRTLFQTSVPQQKYAKKPWLHSPEYFLGDFFGTMTIDPGCPIKHALNAFKID